MVGARSALLNGPISEPIEQQVNAIEKCTRERAPAFAFDLAKTLVESVCKTVLADIGQPADSRIGTAPRLLKRDDKPPEPCCPGTILESKEPSARGSLEKTIHEA